MSRICDQFSIPAVNHPTYRSGANFSRSEPPSLVSPFAPRTCARAEARYSVAVASRENVRIFAADRALYVPGREGRCWAQEGIWVDLYPLPH